MLCKCLWTIYCQIEYGFPLQIHDFFLYVNVIFIRGLKTIVSLAKWLMLTLVCTLTF